MENPYEILNVKQDVTIKELVRAQLLAMRGKYTAKQVQDAVTTLHSPARRLAADFLFPILPMVRVFQPVSTSISRQAPNSKWLDADKYRSL